MQTIADRFIKFVLFDTKSKDGSETFPSTGTQLEFSKVLASEAKSIGLTDVEIDEYGYVTATLPATDETVTRVIGFIAHMDTAPAFNGTNINPKIISYEGGPIKLNENMLLSPVEFPSLNKYVGQKLIITDGTTLLGADDKAGIAEIFTAMEYLIQNPDIKHGKIRIGFTPDEEVGHGVDYFNVEKFGADFAFTIDGGEIGELEYESFNAARAKISIQGKSVHPGSAKNIMINAALVANEIVNALPCDETPATTEGMEGYFHVNMISAEIERGKVDINIRDFDKNKFADRKKFIEEIVSAINKKYGVNTAALEMYDEYLNMKEKIQDKLEIIDLAKEAYVMAGIEPRISSIRGGTDGSRLSYMGLPCPNIFTGAHNSHGPYEYIPINSMIKSAEVIVNICKL